MSIDQTNLFAAGQNVSNMGNNVDYNALGIDQTNITVNFGTTPATVTVKQGSFIEANGNRFFVTGSDFVFQMTLATDNYIVFDESTPEFLSASAKGTYNDSKLGVYQVGDLIRTVRWYIDQTEETVNIDDSLQSYNKGELKTEINGYKIDGTTGKGLTVYSRAGSGSGTVYSDTFEIFKPCTFVFYFEGMPYVSLDIAQGVQAFDFVRRADIEIDFNGGWNAFQNLNNQRFVVSTTGNGTPVFNYFHFSLNPGKYRLRHDAANDVDIYLVGVYGQTNFDASSVIVIT